MRHHLLLASAAVSVLLIVASAATALGQTSTEPTPTTSPEPTPTTTLEPGVSPIEPKTPSAVIVVPIRVVHDSDNNGILDASDTPLPGATVGISPLIEAPPGAYGVPGVSGFTGTTDASGSLEVTLEPGVYAFGAIGPQFLPGDADKPDTICRGWRTAFVMGAPPAPASAASELLERLPAGNTSPVVVSITASDSDPTRAPLVTLGVSDQLVGGGQITCVNLGGPGAEASQLPATGSVTGTSDRLSGIRRVAIIGSSAAFGIFAVLALASRHIRSRR